VFAPPDNNIEIILSSLDLNSPTSPHPPTSFDYFPEDNRLSSVDDTVDTGEAQDKHQPIPSPPADHYYGDDGLLVVNPNGTHPIFELIERAEEAWEKKLGRASKTLGEAVAEYKRRYHRPPPIHFEKWYVISMETKVERAS
jgi:hypothetical protein